MRAFTAVDVVGGAVLAGLLAAPPVLADDPGRDESPVLVSGAALGEFTGEEIDRLAVYRWNGATAAFDPIPFQIDPRVDEVFNAGMADSFTETMYDVLGHDDGLLDDNDELAFMFGDAGPQAPADAAWVDGAEEHRLEVRVTSALPGQPSDVRWVYVFEGDALPRSAVSYVQWNGQVDSPVVTTAFTVGYEGPWLVTGLAIAPPCGSGVDLIDRVKGRAQLDTTGQEDEQQWNGSSVYLGGRVGPIRAIRYVRGAQSAINTIHHDVIYRARWRREINLRVHALRSASLYIDWLPLAHGRFYSPSAMGGVPIDGAPDAVSSAYVPWTVTTSDDGGLVVVHEVAPNPYWTTRSAVYVDDAAYDDDVSSGGDYPDDDDSAYGASGIKISGISNTGVDAISLWFIADVLCDQVGDGTTGTVHREFFDNPFQVVTVAQDRVLGPVRTLVCARDASDVVLSWQPVPEATGYLVLSSDSAGLPVASWTSLGQTSGLTWRDPGAAIGPGNVYYGVIAIGSDGEGEW